MKPDDQISFIQHHAVLSPREQTARELALLPRWWFDASRPLSSLTDALDVLADSKTRTDQLGQVSPGQVYF